MECKWCFGFPCQDISVAELIDTLWNVNFVYRADTVGHNRINRYIMECK